MTKPDACRFCRLFAAFVAAFAALIGMVLVAQFGFGLTKGGGFEYIMPVVALSAARSLGPGVTGSALLVSFVVWAHPLPISQVNAELPRLLKRAMLIALPGYLVAGIVIMVVGITSGHIFFGVAWAAWRVKVVGPADFALGALSALFDAALIVFLARRYLARLQAGQSSLPMKLVLAWTFATGLRITAGLVLSLVLPG